MKRVVVDASVLIAALMANGVARRTLMHTQAALYVPPLIFDEADKHVDRIAQRAGTSAEVIRAVLEIFKERVEELPTALLSSHIEEARKLARDAGDESDAEYVAAALALDAPIWTYDEDFSRIGGIRVCGTAEVRDA